MMHYLRVLIAFIKSMRWQEKIAARMKVTLGSQLFLFEVFQPFKRTYADQRRTRAAKMEGEVCMRNSSKREWPQL